MTHNDELAARYPDLLPTTGENRQWDPELALLIADLDSLSGAPPPPELEERIAAALQLRAAEIRPTDLARRSRELVTIEQDDTMASTVLDLGCGLAHLYEYIKPAYLRPTGGGGEAGRGGEAIMTPRRISTIAAAVAAVLIVSLIGILLYSIRTGGVGAFQQRLLDLGGTQLVLGRSPGAPSTPPISADIPTIQHRLADLIDPADTQVVVDSTSGYLVIYIAGRTSGLQQVFSLVGTTGEIDIIDTGSNPLYIGTDVTGQTCTTACSSGQYKIVFTGAEFNPDSISATTDPQTNQPVVQFEFQGAAQSAFATYTQNNVGNALTITLDNKVIESAIIQSQITGLAQISGGNMTITDAQNLALLLKSGPLAVPLKVISVTSFQPGTPAPTVVSCPTTTPTPTPLTGTTLPEIRVPNVVGEQYATAILNIQQVGLQAVGQQMVDSQVAPGYVIKTSPPGGTLVPVTQLVTIYYSAVQPTSSPLATPTATPPATPTQTPGTSGAISSSSTYGITATPTGPEGACATPIPTPIATASTTPMGTPSGTPMPFQTPTPTPVAP